MKGDGRRGCRRPITQLGLSVHRAEEKLPVIAGGGQVVGPDSQA